MIWENAKNSAAMLIELHGLSALDVALKRVDDCTLFGDHEGEVIWAGILAELTLDDAVARDRETYYSVH